MPPQFYGQEIQVTTGGEIKTPISFQLAGREYIIAEIMQAWQDHGFGQTSAGRKHKWWQRRHRNYYLIKTTENELFEIYYDRGTSFQHPEFRKWILHRKL